MDDKKIGFIGLGTMGAAMAANLCRAGFKVSIWARRSASVTDLVSAGAVWCQSLEQLGRESSIVCFCLSDGASVKEVLLGESGLLPSLRPGSLVIDFSTIAPAESKFISERLSEKEVAYVDAPVSGGDIGAKNATLTVMVGGDEASFKRARPVFEQVGKKIAHAGPIGAGQLTKAVNQIAVALSVAALTESLLFADAAGLDLERTREILAAGAAGSWALENYGPRLLKGDFKPGFAAKYMLKDLRIVLSEAKALGLNLAVVEKVTELYEAMLANGLGDLGNHALIKAYSIKPH